MEYMLACIITCIHRILVRYIRAWLYGHAIDSFSVIFNICGKHNVNQLKPQLPMFRLVYQHH